MGGVGGRRDSVGEAEGVGRAVRHKQAGGTTMSERWAAWVPALS